jgi:multidrug transporter EmrE-like cation transporter
MEEIQDNRTRKEKKEKKKVTIRQVLVLQLVILVYTLSSVAAKYASSFEFLSLKFLGFYGLEIGILGVYAILWQQMIKRIDLSVAYANRAFGVFWSMIWAVLFFDEMVTIKNVIGIVIVFLGIVVVNSDES